MQNFPWFKFRFMRGLMVMVLLSAFDCDAAKLFAVDAQYTGSSGPADLLVENRSFPDLINELFNGSGEFSELSGVEQLNASVRFFAVPDSFRLAYDKQNVDGLFEVQITSSLTGLSKTFLAVDADDLQEKIVDWLFLNADEDAKQLLEAIFAVSTAGLSDGNPGAATARMSDNAFYLFGFYSLINQGAGMRGHESGAHFGLSVNVDSFEIESRSGTLYGESFQVALPLWLHFNQRLSYVGQIDFEEILVEETAFYGLGANMGLAFRPVVRSGMDRFGWQLTPFVGGRAIISVDGVTAAMLYHYGLNNRFEWRVFDRSIVSLVSQYAPYDNLAISVGDYSLNTVVDQQILKNGIMLEVPLAFNNSLVGQVSAIDTRFLEDFGADNYQTYGLGLGYRLVTFSVFANASFIKTDTYDNSRFNLGCGWDL